MMEKQTNIPKLRFPEFTGDWEKKKLGDITDNISSGKSNNKEDIGNYPFYGSTGIIGYSNSYDYSGVKILIARVGANAGSLYKVEGNYCVTDNTLILDLVESINVVFIENYLKNKNLNKLVFGSGQPLITGGQLKSFELSFPTLSEQTRIATFLTIVDSKLQTLKKKKSLLEEYKKGVMQKLFSLELRFKDENERDFPEWRVKKLGEVADRITNKNRENNTNVLTISAQYGLISQLEFFNKFVSAKDVTGYYLLSENDFAYNKSYSTGYPMGALKRLKRYTKGVVSTLYICFRFKAGVDLDFMEHYFETGILNVELEKVAQEGARNHGLLNIGVNDFFNIELNLPSLPEQTRIANFLSTIDEKINQCQKQIEKTEGWKKGLLQKMFV